MLWLQRSANDLGRQTPVAAKYCISQMRLRIPTARDSNLAGVSQRLCRSMCGKAEPFRLRCYVLGLRPIWPGRSPAKADARCGKSETFRTSGGEAAEEMGC